MKKVSHTMTRWHKIATRINAAVAESVESANKKLTQSKFNLLTKAAYSIVSVEALRREGMNDLRLADKLLADLSKVKSVIGQKNVEIGVTQKLSEMDIATRQMNMYKLFLSGNEDKVTFNVFSSVNVADLPKSVYGSDSEYAIAIMSDEDLAEVKEKVAMYKKLASKLSDEVADLNRTSVEIEISEEAIEAASLD